MMLFLFQALMMPPLSRVLMVDTLWCEDVLPDAEGLGEGKIPIYQLCCGACYLLSTFGSSSAEGRDELIPSKLLCCLSLHQLVQVFKVLVEKGFQSYQMCRGTL